MIERLRPAILLICGLLLFAGDVCAQYGFVNFGRNKVQYSDFDWSILKTPHFDIYYYPEMLELAEKGAFFAEEVYTELENRFDVSLNRRVPIIFYSSNLHFKETNVTPGFIPDGVGGFFEFLKGRVVVPANGDIHRFRRVIRHELVHVFTHAKVLRVMRDHRQPPDRFLPLWFTEGLAEYWSGEPDHQHEMVMRDAIASNYLVPLRNITRIRGTYLMYKQGEAICRFISETYGEDKVLRLVENMWKDRDFNHVLEVTLHEPFAEIGRRWESWLRSRYYRMFEEANPPTLVSRGLATRGFSAKPVYYESDSGRRVFFVGNKTGYSNVYSVELDSTYRPIGRESIVVGGERSEQFEAFHLFESRIDVSSSGKLAFVTKSGGQDVVHVYDIEKESLVETFRFPEIVAAYSPSWNPDGTSLVLTAIDKSGYSDLYVYDMTARQLRRLTNDGYDDRDPSWSPDGRYIAFSSDRTSLGKEDANNLFVYDLTTDHVRYVSYGNHHDFSPRWSPDGTFIVYTSARRDSSGRFEGQNVWIADMSELHGTADELASTGETFVSRDPAEEVIVSGREHRQLTEFTSAAFDPVWTADNRLLLSTFEHFRFTIRELFGLDSLIADPRRIQAEPIRALDEPWSFDRLTADDGVKKVGYRRRYNLDIAQSQVSNNAIWGTSGGAFVAVSDMLGDDYWYFTVFNSSQTSGDFLRSLSFAVSRVQLHRRANVGYGMFRFAGRRYDITDPDASRAYPVFWETLYGGYGAISYPISKFRRLELNTTLAWSDKDIFFNQVSRQALLLSNSMAVVHDNALYGYNGPVDGWRANLTLAYTTDLRYSNVSYYTVSADLRRYWRLHRDVSFASRGLVQLNHGREARLFILGGSWDLRGRRLWSVRARKLWFTSHELRFPILNRPSLYVPLLAPFGIANLRGALFLDAAHAWNYGYTDREPGLSTGETIGAAGVGFRMNLFGAFVLRYDIGYRYNDGFKVRDRQRFKQFFFGYDF